MYKKPNLDDNDDGTVAPTKPKTKPVIPTTTENNTRSIVIGIAIVLGLLVVAYNW